MLDNMLGATYNENGMTTIPYACLISRICKNVRCEGVSSDKIPRLPKLLDSLAISKCLGEEYWERRKKRFLDHPPMQRWGEDLDLDNAEVMMHEATKVPPPANPVQNLGVRMDVL